jgi:hypothetical protein
MTIKPGEDWGQLVAPPADLVDVDDDSGLATHLAAGDLRPVRVRGGDLATALGGPSRDGTIRRLPIDVLHVVSEVGELTAVAHVVVRRSWWRGPLLAVMNVDRLGRWDVAPRAHPNDGRADVVAVDPTMSIRARWQAWRRLPSGTHVPHPLIRTRRVTDEAWTFDRPLPLWVDGVARGAVRSLRVVVEPDGAVVHC